MVLNVDEYHRLIEYADNLRYTSPESYALFYEHYASKLYQDYSTFLPRFLRDIDDLINLLLNRPELLPEIIQEPLALQHFPLDFHPFLQYSFGHQGEGHLLGKLLKLLNNASSGINYLPHPRENEVVYIYEDSNPGKEIGLKTHFERLGRYTFVTRLQSYRYLSRNKARIDRIEYLSPDRLGGIFSNKEKSIYYYIYLSENNLEKAQNACQLLNLVFYGESGGL